MNFKRFLRAATLGAVALILASQAGSSPSATVHAWPPEGVDFCAWARDEAYACWVEYENCGGFEVDGCYDRKDQCLMDSGIWLCE